MTSPEADKKKAIKSEGHHARFHVTMLTNTAIEDPLEKTARSPKPRQKGEIFSMMHDVSHRILLKCIVYCYCLMPLFLPYA